jgi:hypothetical protein
MHDHTAFRRCGAGRENTASLHLHHAHAASAVDADFGMVAEGRQLNAGFAYHLKQVSFSLYFNRDTINGHKIF